MHNDYRAQKRDIIKDYRVKTFVGFASVSSQLNNLQRKWQLLVVRDTLTREPGASSFMANDTLPFAATFSSNSKLDGS